MKIIRNATLALALGSAAAIGSAAVTGFAVRQGSQCKGAGTSYIALFTNSPATTLTIYPSTSGKRVLTFSALCSVHASAVFDGYVDPSIEVNGVAQEPTNGSLGFCYSGYMDKAHKTRASITIPIDVVAGANTVRVSMRMAGNGGDLWCLRDSSLVIHQ